MKVKKLHLALALATCSFAFCSCENITKYALEKAKKAAEEAIGNFDNYEDSETLGKVVMREVTVDSITGITVFGATKIVYTQDSISKLVLHGNEKSVEAYDMTVNKGVYEFRHHDDNGKVNRNTPRMTVYVNSPYLKKILLAGAGCVEIHAGEYQDMPMTAEIEGAADFTADSIKCKSFELNVSGVGSAEIGKLSCTEDVEIVVRGAGDINGAVSCEDLQLRIDGAGDADLDATCSGDISINCSGTGSITLRGECDKFFGNSSKTCTIDTSELQIND